MSTNHLYIIVVLFNAFDYILSLKSYREYILFYNWVSLNERGGKGFSTTVRMDTRVNSSYSKII
jgi:hypothetical protein